MNRLHLTGLRWRASTLDLTVIRSGFRTLSLDGNETPHVPATISGQHHLEATF